MSASCVVCGGGSHLDANHGAGQDDHGDDKRIKLRRPLSIAQIVRHRRGILEIHFHGHQAVLVWISVSGAHEAKGQGSSCDRKLRSNADSRRKKLEKNKCAQNLGLDLEDYIWNLISSNAVESGAAAP